MFLKPLNDLRKTAGFRLTAWYSGIFILSSLLLFSFAYVFLATSLREQDRETIQLKVRELSSLYQTGGTEAIEREVAIVKKFEKESPLFIRIAGRDGRTLSLIIPYQWAELDIKELENETLSAASGWIRLPEKSNGNALEIESTQLANDYLLQVGRSTEDRETILRHFREVFAAVVIPLVLCSIIGGAFLGNRARRPIRHLINTVRSVSTGKMDSRVPSPGTGDEFETLGKLFNEMLEKIESLIQAMRGSLDNIAHDLHTPMTRFRGMAERALQPGQTSEACRDALSDCMEESAQILTMLETLMDISEAETGVMKLDRKAVDITILIDKVLDMYIHVAEEKNIDLHLAVPDGLIVSVDPSRMTQVVANLVDNAIKYTQDGGNVHIEAHEQLSQVVITIEDTGVGIPEEDLTRIWDRLYRGDQSRSQRGLGLGLSLVRAIVHAHQGRVDVSSQHGRGTTFSIHLPTRN